jgi:CubicO group peptidase (beta-lactamase class C family)
LLVLTIEQIAKQPLGQYLQANLLAPLGMTDTGNADPTRADYGFGLGLTHDAPAWSG